MDDNLKVLIPLLRSHVYRLLAQGFLYPQESLMELAQQREKWVAIGEELDELTAPNGASGNGDFVILNNKPRIVLSERVAAVVDALQGMELPALRYEYETLFGHVVSKDCPPYETNYGRAHIFMQAQQLSDIAAFYRAFSMDVSDAVKERVDHIGIELEFMHFLTYKEAYAHQHHGEEQAQICVDAQQKFLREHLGRWAPVLARMMQRQTSHGVYSALAALLEDFLSVDCRTLGVRPLAVEEKDVQIGAFELDNEACAGCELVADVG
jgi:DMSO reductase family type II enzyme chaperone